METTAKVLESQSWMQTERIRELEAENERLRAALRRIADSQMNDFNTLHPEACARVAREALKTQ